MISFRSIGAMVLMAAAMSPAAPGTAMAETWAGAWGYATSPATGRAKGELPAGTYRFRLRLSTGGDGVKLTLRNPEGAVPLVISRAVVAPASGSRGFEIDPNTAHALSFAGKDGATIAAGSVAVSDDVAFAVRDGGDMIVSVTVSAPSTTVAGNAGFPAAFAQGVTDPAAAIAKSVLQEVKLRPFVTMVAVRNPARPCTIVTLGDSITEGARGTVTGWRGWPGAFASQLARHRKGGHCGVVNAGISGNRVLRNGRGTAAVDRFDRDVASVPGASDVILLEGINDIWRAGGKLSAADLIAGYRVLIRKAHAHGIRVIGGTMTPGWSSKYLRREMEDVREQVNAWIRTGGEFDGVIDFEAAVRDTSAPPQITRAFDSGDHLHPGNAGYQAMGRAVPMSMFP